MKRHGCSSPITPEYATWRAMKQRAFNKNHKGYQNYGGRGITVCQRWCNSFESFVEDLGLRPSPKHSIDRTDNNGNYSCGKCDECLSKGWPLNASWAPPQIQHANRRDNLLVTFNGQTKTLIEWAAETGIAYSTLKDRFHHGWDTRKMLMQPPMMTGANSKHFWPIAKQIRELYASGLRQVDISRKLNINRAIISRVVLGQTYSMKGENT